MLNKDLLLKRASKIEDKLFLSKIIDKASRAGKHSVPVHTDFLDPRQRDLVEKALGAGGEISYTACSGYNGGERAIFVFYPVFISPDTLPYEEYLKVIKIGLRSREGLTHRDYLGSLIGLGIKREKIGDILVRQDSADIIVLSEIAGFIKYNLEKIGTSRVDVEIGELSKLSVPEPRVREINATVASLRLDCIASAGFGISRTKIGEYIKGEKLNLNWETTGDPSRTVKEGDTVSIRGKGRIILESVGGRTRKDRISILIKKFV